MLRNPPPSTSSLYIHSEKTEDNFKREEKLEIKKLMEKAKGQKHFVLVHGGCHGAWCWYKLKPWLQNAGHRVTAVDLAASGIHMKAIHEAQTLHDYTQPLLELMAALPAEEKVVLVGHSLGGMNLALAMDIFPHKIEVAVFLSAFMPDTSHQPSYIIEQDLELGMMLKRPSSLFLHDLSKAKKFSDEGYGGVRRVFVVCCQDKGIPETFQRWMIENGGVKEVKQLEGADHMPMLNMPQQLGECLVGIAEKCG
ncbi:hypothetical protein Ancab_003745 [Ancistrocladus abbreviatus]